MEFIDNQKIVCGVVPDKKNCVCDCSPSYSNRSPIGNGYLVSPKDSGSINETKIGQFNT